jgi:hypothetical protein
LKKILVLQSQTLTILAEVDQDKNRPSCKSTTTNGSHVRRRGMLFLKILIIMQLQFKFELLLLNKSSNGQLKKFCF